MKLYSVIVSFTLMGCALTGYDAKKNETECIRKTVQIENKKTINLTILTNPNNARVRIMNIKPRYYPGIKLSQGKYEVYVTKLGFKAKRIWIDVTQTTVMHATLVTVNSSEESHIKTL